MTLAVTVAVVIAVLCIIEGTFFYIRNRLDPEARRVRDRLRGLSEQQAADQITDLTRFRPLSAVPQLDTILRRVPFLQGLDNILVQANLKQPLGVFVLLSFVLAAAGFALASMTQRHFLAGLLFGGLLGAIPMIYVLTQKWRRMKKFERQLPDALDLIARSLRAGHAFSTGLGMVGQEFEDPVGPEFRKTQTQIGLGVSMDQALKALLQRIDCPDLRFFAVSVIIQRESGGNMAEILESIASLTRARFKLRGKIKALSAEGKLSAIILLALPVFVALALWVVNPSYLQVLTGDPLGKTLVICALLMMGIGVLSIKRMIDIKV
jgi:tight adherence protein B